MTTSTNTLREIQTFTRGSFKLVSLKYFKWPWEVLKSGFAWVGWWWVGRDTCVLVLFRWNIIDTDRWQRQETFTLIHDKHSYIGVPSSHKKKANTRVFSELQQAAVICRGRRSPNSVTARNFKLRGGRYRRPRQKNPTLAPRLREMRQKCANFITEVGKGGRGMVQPSIDSFRRANKRFQFSLLCRLLTRECLTNVKHEQRARFLESQAILYQKKVEK